MPSKAHGFIFLLSRSLGLPPPLEDGYVARIIPPETLMMIFSDVRAPAMFAGGGGGNTFDVHKDITPPKMVSLRDPFYDTTPPVLIIIPSEYSDLSAPNMAGLNAIQSDTDAPKMSASKAPQTYY